MIFLHKLKKKLILLYDFPSQVEKPVEKLILFFWALPERNKMVTASSLWPVIDPSTSLLLELEEKAKLCEIKIL